jgi:kynurenine formamidase
VARQPAADVLGYMETLSNWGRWGPEDRLGTLNLVTPACRRDAAALVREGISVSCAHDIDPSILDPIHQFHRYMVMSGEGLADEHRLPHMMGGTSDQRWSPSREYLGMVFHGPLVTHVDAPSHMSWDQKIFNGYPAERVNSISGAIDLPVSAMAEGITTRGVLIDVPGSRQVDALEPGTAVEPDELAQIESDQGSVVRPGDAVLLRTGGAFSASADHSAGPWNWQEGKSGWSASCLQWLHERDVAIIGHDGSNDVAPSGFASVGMPAPIHVVALVAMGLWLIDNVALEALAETCRRLQRWEFMMSISALRIAGGTGSPVNPIATF